MAERRKALAADKKADEERDYLWTHTAGRASSLEEAAALARQNAGACFANSNDALAGHWREVATWLAGMAKNEREKQDQYREAVND